MIFQQFVPASFDHLQPNIQGINYFKIKRWAANKKKKQQLPASEAIFLSKGQDKNYQHVD